MSTRTLLALAFAAACVAWPRVSAQDVTATSCHVPELSHSFAEYDALVCNGMREFERGRFKEAAEVFVRAMEVPFEEYPNFHLLSRLAQAQWRAGSRDVARVTLEKAELTIRVQVGIYLCSDFGGPTLQTRLSQSVNTSRVADFVESLCAIAYSPYGVASLGHLQQMAELSKVLEASIVMIRGEPKLDP